MKDSKATDKEFNVHCTIAYTTRDANKDILKISAHLIETCVTSAVENRTKPEFKDPTDDKLAKICNTSWVQDVLSKAASLHTEDGDLIKEERENIVDLNYEISDVV